MLGTAAATKDEEIGRGTFSIPAPFKSLI
jgi:hypothetical protein